ncbi:MAG: hypothetical protein RL324_143 [Verrucomicrobiota bacterium]|jgi:uncharacterized protein (TIGR02231 family)
MKRFVLSAFAMFAFVSAFAATIPAKSNITTVTVYADRAVVTRTATVDLATGTHEVVFEGLPATLGDNSLQVAGRGTASATILDLAARQIFVPLTPNDRVRSLEEDLKTVQRQIRVLDDRAAIVNDQKNFVARMLAAATTAPAPAPNGTTPARPSLDEWRQLQGYSEEATTKWAKEIQDIDRQKEDHVAAQTAIQRQLNELRGAGNRAQKTVTVRVDAASAGNLQLALSYTVPNASWVPAYDARLRTAARTVELSYFGVVRQNTGEDWNNVALTLSTARPSLGGAAPEYAPWIVDVNRPVAMAAKANAAPGAVYSTINRGFSDALGAADVQEATFAQASVEQGATSATFKITAPATIPANNTTQKVAINGNGLAALLEYNSTPKLREAAFLTAKATNTTEFPLLAGTLNTFLDDTFVATGSLKSVMPGEKFDLALGADDGIAIKRRVVNRFTENTGLTNGKRLITYEYVVTVTNNKKTAEKITVREPVPQSRNEQIVVKMITPADRDIGTPEVKKEIIREANGGLAWESTLQPGGKRELTLKFSIEHPAELAVSGLE